MSNPRPSEFSHGICIDHSFNPFCSSTPIAWSQTAAGLSTADAGAIIMPGWRIAQPGSPTRRERRFGFWWQKCQSLQRFFCQPSACRGSGIKATARELALYCPATVSPDRFARSIVRASTTFIPATFVRGQPPQHVSRIPWRRGICPCASEGGETCFGCAQRALGHRWAHGRRVCRTGPHGCVGSVAGLTAAVGPRGYTRARPRQWPLARAALAIPFPASLSRVCVAQNMLPPCSPLRFIRCPGAESHLGGA